jgi:hypothetical protein
VKAIGRRGPLRYQENKGAAAGLNARETALQDAHKVVLAVHGRHFAAEDVNPAGHKQKCLVPDQRALFDAHLWWMHREASARDGGGGA